MPNTYAQSDADIPKRKCFHLTLTSPCQCVYLRMAIHINGRSTVRLRSNGRWFEVEASNKIPAKIHFTFCNQNRERESMGSSLLAEYDRLARCAQTKFGHLAAGPNTYICTIRTVAFDPMS